MDLRGHTSTVGSKGIGRQLAGTLDLELWEAWQVGEARNP
jgi:hypothetical protein